jgi:hypothetical protein
MRRTFPDLARAAEVRDIVTRSISGHSTEAMQRHYSTVSGKEQKDGLARVVELAKFRQAARLDPSGEISGEARAEAETAVGACPPNRRQSCWTFVGRTGFGPVTSTV